MLEMLTLEGRTGVVEDGSILHDGQVEAIHHVDPIMELERLPDVVPEMGP